MIQENTVLVLGAGASLPYGFPSGPKLIDDIIKQLAKESSNVRVGLARCNVDPDEVAVFRSQLLASDSKSIDSFIAKDIKRQKIGKICIASLLMMAERDSLSPDGLLRPKKEEGKRPDHWYAILKQALETEHPVQLGDNRLAVITFNYDRSLEHYLYGALIADYGLKHKAEIIRAVKSIRFVHVYGKLGGMPWDDGNVLEYGRVAMKETELDRVSGDISVMGEQTSQNYFTQAREILAEGDKIVFLGFGYHDPNMKELKIRGLNPDARIVTGTRMGLTKLQVHRISKYFPLLSRLHEVDENHCSSDLLRHEILLDGEIAACQIQN